eukprot:gene5944-146_t
MASSHGTHPLSRQAVSPHLLKHRHTDRHKVPLSTLRPSTFGGRPAAATGPSEDTAGTSQVYSSFQAATSSRPTPTAAFCPPCRRRWHPAPEDIPAPGQSSDLSALSSFASVRKRDHLYSGFTQTTFGLDKRPCLTPSRSSPAPLPSAPVLSAFKSSPTKVGTPVMGGGDEARTQLSGSLKA